MGSRLALLVGLVTLIAGCAGGGSAKDASPSTSTVGTVTVGDNSTGEVGSIVGRVVDDEHAPIPQATVGIISLGAELVTGPDGGFEFKDVPAGTHSIVANRLGYDSVARKVEVVAQETVELTLTLTPIKVVEPYFESIQKKSLHHLGETYVTFAVNLTGQSPLCDGCVFVVHYTPNDLPSLILWEIFGKHTVSNPLGDKEHAWAFVNGPNGGGGTLVVERQAILPVRIEFPNEQVVKMDKKKPLIWFQLLCEDAWVCFEESRENWVTAFYQHEEFPEDFSAVPPA